MFDQQGGATALSEINNSKPHLVQAHKNQLLTDGWGLQTFANSKFSERVTTTLDLFFFFFFLIQVYSAVRGGFFFIVRVFKYFREKGRERQRCREMQVEAALLQPSYK